MNLYRFWADAELAADGFIRQALGGQRQDLPLSRRQALQTFRQHRRCVVRTMHITPPIKEKPHRAGDETTRENNRLAARARYHRAICFAETDRIEDNDLALG